MILLSLFIKHLIVDFFLQNPFPYQWQNKGKYGHLGGIIHSGLHLIGTFLVCLFFTSIPMALLFGILDGVIHYHMDWFKVWWCNKKNYHMQTLAYWNWLGIDQTVHNLTYVLIFLMV